MLIAGAGARLLHGIAAESAREGNGEYRAGERISAALKRDAPLDVNGAIGFAKELGISPSYAGLFAGGSQVMRNALTAATQTANGNEQNSKRPLNFRCVPNGRAKRAPSGAATWATMIGSLS